MRFGHIETPGERAVKAELRHLGLRFIQEEKITGLKWDSKQVRYADFYLPDYDVYIEFLGSQNTSAEHRIEYAKKKRAYQQNGIKCIWIYPNQLTHTSTVIKNGLQRFGVTSPSRSKKQERVIIYNTPRHDLNWAAWLILIGIIALAYYAQSKSLGFSNLIDIANKNVELAAIPDFKVEYDQFFEKLQVGMTAKEVFSSVPNYWEFNQLNPTAVDFYKFTPTQNRIQVSFKDVFRKADSVNGGVTSIYWTDAKVTNIILFEHGKKIAEK